MNSLQPIQKQAQRVESLTLTVFPLAFILCVQPAQAQRDAFTTGRFSLSVAFLLVVLLLRLIGHAHLSAKELGQLALRQPVYMWCLGLFLLSATVSSVVSPTPAAAWFGSRASPTGTLFIMLGAALFWVYSTAWHVRLWGWQAATVVVSLLTIAEFLGFRPLSLWLGSGAELTTAYPAATIGHRGHLAGLLVMMSLLQVYWHRQRLQSWRFWLSFCLSCVALGCTSNSASYVAMTLALLLFAVAGLRLTRGHVLAPRIVLLVPVVALLAMTAYRPLTTVNAGLVRGGWIEQVAESKDLSNTRTFSTRLLLWKAAVGMAAARPLVGWGPQAFYNHWYTHLSKAEGDQLFRLELSLPAEWKLVRINDSAAYQDDQGKTTPQQLNYFSSHNAALDLLSSQGVLGVLSFGAFVLALLLHFSRLPRPLIVLALLAPLGYGIYLMAWFVTLPVTLAVCICGGMLVSSLRQEEQNANPELSPGRSPEQDRARPSLVWSRYG